MVVLLDVREMDGDCDDSWTGDVAVAGD